MDWKHSVASKQHEDTPAFALLIGVAGDRILAQAFVDGLFPSTDEKATCACEDAEELIVFYADILALVLSTPSQVRYRLHRTLEASLELHRELTLHLSAVSVKQRLTFDSGIREFLRDHSENEGDCQVFAVRALLSLFHERPLLQQVICNILRVRRKPVEPSTHARLKDLRVARYALNR